MIVYFSGDIVWRERTARVAEIVDATPAPSAAFLAAKTAAVWLLAALMIAAAIAVGIGVQLAAGHRPISPRVHASLFCFAGVPLALLALAAVVLQTLAPNRLRGDAVHARPRGLRGGSARSRPSIRCCGSAACPRCRGRT